MGCIFDYSISQDLFFIIGILIMNQQLQPPYIVIMPGWVYRSIIRNKLNIIDASNYSKMRKILSLNDIAEWQNANASVNVQKEYLGGFGELIFENMNDSEKNEMKNTILPLSGSIQIAENVKIKLSVINDMVETAYQFIRNNNTLYVILNEGFLSKTTDRRYTMDFVKNYLAQCYSLTTIHEVSKMSIFKLYIKLLNQFRISYIPTT